MITLQQAMDVAATTVYLDRRKFDEQFGPGLFDKAVEHHTKKRLRADIETGTTYRERGWVAQFVSYDWEDHYKDAPHFVWFDFFLPIIGNSVSRMSRGLEP